MAFNISYNFIAVNKFSRTADKISRSVDKVNAKISKASKNLRDFGSKFTARVTLPMAAFAGFALKNAAAVESFQVRLAVLLRSTEKAKDLMKELTDFTAKTPFQLPGVVKTASQLLAFGFQADKIVETMRVLGDVAAGSGSSIGDIGLIFGQIKGESKLTGERFLQLATRGVPIAASLSKVTGIAETRIKDAISEGLIGFELVEKAFQDMTKEGSVFFKATERQSKTLGGLFSTLKDNIFLSLASIGQTLVDTFDLKTKIAELIVNIANLTTKFNNFVKNNPKLTKFLFTMISIVAILPPLIFGLGLVVGAFSSLITVISAGLTVLGVIGVAIGIIVGAIGIIPVVIISAVAALTLLFLKVEKVRDIFFEITGAIKDFAKTLGSGISKTLGFETQRSGLLEAAGMNVGSPALVGPTQDSKSEVNVNINAPEGVVQSVSTKSKGPTRFNLGQNGRLATVGAY